MFALRNLLSRLAKPTAKVGVQSSIPARTWAAGGVWGLWSIAVIWTAVFIARHGHNLPANDEWAFVSITYASWADKFEWLGERHMEHRFPLARAVFLGLLEATGHDYRAGMWMTLGLFAATAATLILAARRLRGHTSLADAAFPFLFLHVGHTENLLMGYQIVFTITVLALRSSPSLSCIPPNCPPAARRCGERRVWCPSRSAAGLGWYSCRPSCCGWPGRPGRPRTRASAGSRSDSSSPLERTWSGRSECSSRQRPGPRLCTS